MGFIWREGKEKNRKKVEHLLNKWKTPGKENAQKTAPPIRNVKYTDKDLADVIISDKNDVAVSYGGVQVTENMESVLKMNPKMMVYNKIDSWDMEAEIEKGFAKCRYNAISEAKKEAGEVRMMRIPLTWNKRQLIMGKSLQQVSQLFSL